MFGSNKLDQVCGSNSSSTRKRQDLVRTPSALWLWCLPIGFVIFAIGMWNGHQLPFALTGVIVTIATAWIGVACFLSGLFAHLRGSLDSRQDDDTRKTGQNRPQYWWSDDALAGSGHGRDHLPPAGEHCCCPGSSTDSPRCRLLEPEHGITSCLPESACAGESQRDADHHS